MKSSQNFYKSFRVSNSKCDVILRNSISQLENSEPREMLQKQMLSCTDIYVHGDCFLLVKSANQDQSNKTTHRYNNHYSNKYTNCNVKSKASNKPINRQNSDPKTNYQSSTSNHETKLCKKHKPRQQFVITFNYRKNHGNYLVKKTYTKC